MSQKITSKNLSYDTTLPPFLARLRGQQTTNDTGPDPMLAARRRAARVRTASEEAEDAPVVVDEDGNVVQLDEGTPGREVRGGDGEGTEEKAGSGDVEPLEKEKEKEKVAGIGANRKRKAGRVVGGGEDHDEDGKDGGASDAMRKAAAKARDLGGSGDKTVPKNAKPAAPKTAPKKKAKKIKLSFGDDEGD
jgi:hypothetical protein